MLEYISFAFLLVFGFIMSQEDIKLRKVTNVYTLVFLLISFLLFLIKQVSDFVWYDSVILASVMIFSFALFHKKIFGAADGKIIIGIVMFLLVVESLFVFDFFINVIVLYTLTLLLLVLFKTSLSSKKKIFLKTPFSLLLFQTLFTLSFLALFSRFVGFERYDILVTLSVFIVFLFILSPIAKKLFSKLDENSQIVVSFMLFSYAFYDLFGLFLTSFLYLFFIKFFLFTVTELSDYISYSNNQKTYPLVPILFISALTVFFLGKNLVLILFGL
jgi:Flp pilus assembly protein protease CpaA